MELTHDWRAFQDVFYPHKRTVGPTLVTPGKTAPVYLVVDGDTVLTAYCEGEDLASWVGAPLSEAHRHAAGREVVTLERKELERWTQESMGQGHFHDQVQSLRALARPKQGALPAHQRHFLLQALDSWWGKVLPSAYGVFFRIAPEGRNPERELVIVMRRGKLEAFLIPDLTSLGAERRREMADVVKYLSEKYLVPFQGITLRGEDWTRWSRDANPWRDVAKSIKANQTQLVPFRWSLALLSTTRAFFRV